MRVQVQSPGPQSDAVLQVFAGDPLPPGVKARYTGRAAEVQKFMYFGEPLWKQLRPEAQSASLPQGCPCPLRTTGASEGDCALSAPAHALQMLRP